MKQSSQGIRQAVYKPPSQSNLSGRVKGRTYWSCEHTQFSAAVRDYTCTLISSFLAKAVCVSDHLTACDCCPVGPTFSDVAPFQDVSHHCFYFK